MVVALGQEGVEGVLAGVPARPVAAVVAQRDRLGQGDVHPDVAGDRGGHLGHLQRVGQPGALVIAGVHHDLGLPGQPPKGGGVHDPVAVAFEAGPLRVGLLLPGSIAGAEGPGGRGGEMLGLPRLALLAQDRTGQVQPRARLDARTTPSPGWPAIVVAQAIARGDRSGMAPSWQLVTNR